MKTKLRHSSAFVAITLVLPAAADTIYSNLRDISIPTGRAGVFVDVDGVNGWDINPFYGGVGVANSPAFQPARVSLSGDLPPLQDFAVGATIDASRYYSSGYGGSQTHLGTTFTAGLEEYLGFRLDGNYGWMRVVFTGNTSGAKVLDWAYDNSGAPIVVGRVQQGAVENGSQLVTLSPGSGEAFTLGSQITGSSRVLKTGDGSTTLTGINNFSGITDVNAGVLLVNGSLTGLGTVTVAGGATLGGTGSIAGAVSVSGTLAPGASIESLATGTLTLNNGSTFAYEMNSAGVTADFLKVTGDLVLDNSSGGKVYLTLADLALSPVAFAPNTTLSLINYTGAWNGGFFTYGSNELADNEVFTAGANTWQIHYGATSGGLNFVGDQVAGGFVNLTSTSLTAVPEPGSLLALGCLVGSGILLRSRRRKV